MERTVSLQISSLIETFLFVCIGPAFVWSIKEKRILKKNIQAETFLNDKTGKSLNEIDKLFINWSDIPLNGCHSMWLSYVDRNQKKKNIPYFIQNLREDCLLGSKISNSMTKGWLDSRCIIQEETNGKPIHLQILNIIIDLLLHSGDFETTAILTRDNVSADFLYNNLLKDSRVNRRHFIRKIGRTRGTEDIFRKLIFQLSIVNDDVQLRSWIGCFFQHIIPKKYADDLNVIFESEFGKDPKSLFSSRRKPEFIQLRAEWEKVLPNVSLENIDTIAETLDFALGLSKSLTRKWGPLDVDVSYFAQSIINSLKRFVSVDTSENQLLSVCEHLENDMLTVARLIIERLPKGIYITTVHQSKGREFSHVIIPWLSNEVKTKFFRYKFDHERFEDRKLLYVACTRATKKVTILFPKENPSNFIQQWKLR